MKEGKKNLSIQKHGHELSIFIHRAQNYTQ
jgi:hypothetical protein